MTDVHDPEIRSYNMSMIRSTDTKPEMIVRKYLFARGYRYRLHYKKLPGKPDIVLPKYNTVIFVNGCFWHGHKNCKYFVIPKTNTEWWLNKIQKTKLIDNENVHKIKEMNWKVLIIFECELKKAMLDKTLKKLLNELH